jgi:hypothetical protein
MWRGRGLAKPILAAPGGLRHFGAANKIAAPSIYAARATGDGQDHTGLVAMVQLHRSRRSLESIPY